MTTSRAEDVSPVLTATAQIRSSPAWNKDVLCAVVLCVLELLTWLPRIRGPIDLRWDAGVYYTLGTSLAQGKGYRLLNEPGEIQAIQYPPGLPALVAVHEKVLRTDEPAVVGIWLRRTWCVLSLLYTCLIFFLSRRFFSTGYAFLLTLVCLLNYQMIFLSTLCFAELPFAVASVLFAYLYLRGPGRMTEVFSGGAAIAAYLIRSAGIALLITWIADAALRKQFRKACVRAAISLIPLLLWQSYIHSVESSEPYKHPYYAYQRDPWVFYNVSYATNVALKRPFDPELGPATKSDLLLRFANNAVTMPAVLGEAISGRKGFWEGHLARLNRLLRIVQIPKWTCTVVLAGLGLLVLSGLIWMLRRRQWLIPIYLLLSVAAICSTPWPGQFPRYMAPLEPFLLIAFLVGAIGVQTWAQRRLPSNPATRVLAITIGAIVLGESAVSCVVAYRNFREPAVYEDSLGVRHGYTLFHYPAGAGTENGLRWLVAHADRNAIVAVSVPQWVYLKTTLKTVMPPLEPDANKAQQMLDSVPVTYIALDHLLAEDKFNLRFPALVRSSPDRWRLVYTDSGHEFDIYERVGVRRDEPVNHIQLPNGKSLRF